MSTLLIVLLLCVFLFGWGGYTYGGTNGPYIGGGLGLVMLIIIVVLLVRGGTF
jgi:hypothetical protein